MSTKIFSLHQGPGPHPGTGTEQKRHQPWREDPYTKHGHVELVPIDILKRMAEFNREYQYKWGYSTVDELTKDIEEHGLIEPIIIDYSAVNHKAYIGEGNHRLAAAIRLGLKALPARIVTTKRYPNTKGMVVSGLQPDKYGYISSNPRPSEIGLPTLPIETDL